MEIQFARDSLCHLTNKKKPTDTIGELTQKPVLKTLANRLGCSKILSAYTCH